MKYFIILFFIAIVGFHISANAQSEHDEIQLDDFIKQYMKDEQKQKDSIREPLKIISYDIDASNNAKKVEKVINISDIEFPIIPPYSDFQENKFTFSVFDGRYNTNQILYCIYNETTGFRKYYKFDANFHLLTITDCSLKNNGKLYVNWLELIFPENSSCFGSNFYFDYTFKTTNFPVLEELGYSPSLNTGTSVVYRVSLPYFGLHVFGLLIPRSDNTYIYFIDSPIEEVKKNLASNNVKFKIANKTSSLTSNAIFLEEIENHNTALICIDISNSEL